MLHGCECRSGAAKLLHCCHLLCCTANFMPHIQTCMHAYMLGVMRISYVSL
jgi:hypothetical protein